MSNAQIEVVQLGERKYIGIAATSPLKNVKGIGEAHQLFMERKVEIQGMVDENTYVCVHFANEVLFTYIYCMEVNELQPVPEGMIGFEVPRNQYVKVQSNGEEPYGLINKFLIVLKGAIKHRRRLDKVQNRPYTTIYTCKCRSGPFWQREKKSPREREYRWRSSPMC